MNTMNINEFYFPVSEREVLLNPETDRRVRKIPDYKAIVARINGYDRVVSVVRNSYRLVRNRELIEPFIEQVDKLGVEWQLDESHSFVELNRMRLQVTFPEILIRDEESDIPISIYLHNSYDQSEGVRLFIGALRAICSNGLVFGNLMSRFYGRHTQGFSFQNLHTHFDGAIGKIDSVQERIHQLRSIPVDEPLVENLQQVLGKKRLSEILLTDRVPDASQWDLMNNITYFISHNVEKPRRGDLQMKLSSVFQL